LHVDQTFDSLRLLVVLYHWDVVKTTAGTSKSVPLNYSATKPTPCDYMQSERTLIVLTAAGTRVYYSDGVCLSVCLSVCLARIDMLVCGDCVT